MFDTNLLANSNIMKAGRNLSRVRIDQWTKPELKRSITILHEEEEKEVSMLYLKSSLYEKPASDPGHYSSP